MRTGQQVRNRPRALVWPLRSSGFDASSTDITSSALVFFCIGMAFNGASLLLIRAFFALKRPWLPTFVAAIGAVLFAPLAWMLSLRMELDGIALATSIVSLVTFMVLLELLRRELGGIGTPLLIDGFVRSLVAGAAAAGIAWAVWWAADDILGRSLPAQIASVGVAGAIGVGALLSVAGLLGLGEVRKLLKGGLSLR